MSRLLITGSREYTDKIEISKAITSNLYRLPGKLTVIHGAAIGADTIADEVAKELGHQVEPYPAEDFASPRARNQHMVDLGADLCISFALKWASGTGMCARMARRAGIPVIDWLEPTA